MWLLIDIGNTTTDFRSFNLNSGKITPLFRPLTSDPHFHNINNIVNKLNDFNLTFEKIILVSVVPDSNPIIRELGWKLKIPVLNLRHDFNINQDDFEVDINVLGADFIANYLGYVNEYHSKNAIIISMGTATTTFVVQNNKFIGTTISPGMGIAFNSLVQSASLLKDKVLELTNSKIGKNTDDALSMGSVQGHYLMILGIIDLLKKDFKFDDIIFTGGYSKIIKELIERDGFTYNEDLIFKGIKKLA